MVDAPVQANIIELYSRGHHTNKKFMAERGDIFYASPQITKEETVIQKGNRPIVIISCKEGNDSSVHYNYLPLTSIDNKTKANIPTHVRIGSESGVKRPSIVLVEQTMTIDDEDLKFKIGHCPDSKMAEIDDALERQLMLGKYRKTNENEKGGENNDKEVKKFVSEDEQARKEKAKKIETYKSILIALNLLNEIIYDDRNDSLSILKKRDMRLFDLKEFLSNNTDDYRRALKSRLKHYDKVKEYL